MTITKILARSVRLDLDSKYILNGDRAAEHTLTAHFSCGPGRERGRCRAVSDRPCPEHGPSVIMAGQPS